MWYYAASFPTIEEARSAFQRAFTEMQIRKWNFLSGNTMIDTYEDVEYYICTIYGEISSIPVIPEIVAMVGGKRYRLNYGIVQNLIKARAANVIKAFSLNGLYESHEQHYEPVVMTKYPIKTDRVKHARKSMPYYAIYREMELERIQAMPHDDAEIIMLIAESVRNHEQKYLFEKSARNMLHAVMQDDIQWPADIIPFWIEHEIPDNLVKDHNLLAIEVAPVSGTIFSSILSQKEIDAFPPQLMVRNIWSITVFDDALEYVAFIYYDQDENQYKLDDLHLCSHCLPESYDMFANLLPCDDCFQNLIVPVLRYAFTAHAMIQKKFAVRPEGNDFEDQIQQWSTVESHITDRGKKRFTEVQHNEKFTVIRYEVSEKSLSETDIEEAERDTGSNRTSWLQLHDSSQIIYVQRTIDDHERRYPVRRDGTRLEGTVHVHYDGPKYVPMLAANATTYRQVTAKRYKK